MATPISGGTAFDFGAAAQAAAVQPQVTTTTTASVKQPIKIEPAATVKLSDDAQVRLLNSQGHSVSQIAVLTDLSTQAVNGYLGVAHVPPPMITSSNK
jgi:hypothetical protein